MSFTRLASSKYRFTQLDNNEMSIGNKNVRKTYGVIKKTLTKIGALCSGIFLINQHKSLCCKCMSRQIEMRQKILQKHVKISF
jgi:hypothetical protein